MTFLGFICDVFLSGVLIAAVMYSGRQLLLDREGALEERRRGARERCARMYPPRVYGPVCGHREEEATRRSAPSHVRRKVA